MKTVTLAKLEADLGRNPEDWSIRLRLIEGHILENNKDAARRLVRESPDDTPLPAELQLRLHTVMTQGAPAVERYYAEQHGGESPFVRRHRKQILPQPPKSDFEERNGQGGQATESPAGDLKKKINLPTR